MKIKNYAFICFLLFHFSSICFGQNITRLNKGKISVSTLDAKIESLMNSAHLTGLAVVVFNNKKAVYKKTFGYKNTHTKEPINNQTSIYGASLSKTVFAVMVMTLVQKGILDLDKPLQEYLPQPIYDYNPTKNWHDNYLDLKEDTAYRKITARMCLDHTTGFPNWRWNEPDEKLRVKSTPGSRYSYSGEGLVYLQVVLERYLGKTLEEMMRENVFIPLKMNNSSYTWQSKFEKNYCVGHNENGEVYEKDKDNEARGASTLETTLDDYTLFIKGIFNNELLNAATTKAMFTQQIKIRSIKQFGPLSLRDSTANDKIKLGYGLGWGLLQSPYGTGAFKEGHGDGFQHYSIIFPRIGTGIVLLSNSENAESIYKEVLEIAIGDTYTPWLWQNYIPYNQKE